MNRGLLVPMRLCATVAHALPDIRLRLHDEGRTILEVARTDEPAHGAVIPCAFRRAVARAHLLTEAGERLRFLGMPEGVAPAIDVAVAGTGAIHPGGIYSIARGDLHLHAFPTTVGPARCRALVDTALCTYHDAATEITVVHLRTGSETLPSVLEEALLRCADEELAHELGPPMSRSTR